ncbi:MAG: DUF4396 domain-containing protein [Thermoanaerobaculia bacterium]
MIPEWFSVLSVAMLALGALCALVIVVDILRGHRQQMWIMNVVWPVTALFGTVLALWAYRRWGRLATRQRYEEARERGEKPPNRGNTPFAAMVAKGAAHCGSGCALGDLCAEFLAFGAPAVLTWLGWRTLFPPTDTGKMFAVWVLDYLFAFAFGVAFQYFTIQPMRDLTPGRALVEAVKADALSLTSWQVGMYGFMAFAHLVLFGRIWRHPIHADMPEFWFAMQIAMLCGFATAYPVNWWLLRSGIKERM